MEIEDQKEKLQEQEKMINSLDRRLGEQWQRLTRLRESSSMTDQTVEQTRGLMAMLANTIGKSNARINKLVIRQKSTKTLANTLCRRLDELEKDE
jgi:uncharacterized coiled-coil protein SlyX